MEREEGGEGPAEYWRKCKSREQRSWETNTKYVEPKFGRNSRRNTVRKRQPRRATRSKNSPIKVYRHLSLSLLRAFHFVHDFGNRSCSLYIYNDNIYNERRNRGIMARISRHGCSPYSRYCRFFLITKLPRRCSRVTSLIAPRSPAPHSY